MRVKPNLVFALAAGLSLIGESAVAFADPTTVPIPASPIKNDTGKRICRVVTPTGSRFTQRVCKTADEWLKDADNAQRHMEESVEGIRENGCGLQCPQ